MQGRLGLKEAAAQGNLELMEEFLSGTEIDVVAEELNAALVSAVEHKHPEAVDMLCERGADWRTPVERFGNVLVLAASTGSIPVMQALITRGADVAEAIRDGNNPLAVAAIYDDDAMLEFLQGLGFSLNQPDGHGQLLIVDAVCSDALPCVKALIAAGADPHLREKRDKGTSAFWMALGRNSDGIARCILGTNDVTLDCKCIRALATGLFRAVAAGDEQAVEAVLQRIPSLVHARNQKGYSPFQVAVLSDRMEMAEYLLGWEADINARDGGGGTVLHAMCAQKKFDAAIRLIALKIGVALEDDRGLTALHYAAEYCGESFVHEMLRVAGLSRHSLEFSLAPFFTDKEEEDARRADRIVLALIGDELITALTLDSSDSFVKDMEKLGEARAAYHTVAAHLRHLPDEEIARILGCIVFASQALNHVTLDDPLAVHLMELFRFKDFGLKQGAETSVRRMTMKALCHVGLEFDDGLIRLDEKGLVDPLSDAYHHFCRLPQLTQGLLAELLN
jgi:ankyrin repeat protein